MIDIAASRGPVIAGSGNEKVLPYGCLFSRAARAIRWSEYQQKMGKRELQRPVD
jgi:hypothetical protein